MAARRPALPLRLLAAVAAAVAALALAGTAAALPSAPVITTPSANPAPASYTNPQALAWDASTPEAGCVISGYQLAVDGANQGAPVTGLSATVSLPSTGSHHAAVTAIQEQDTNPTTNPKSTVCPDPGGASTSTVSLTLLVLPAPTRPGAAPTTPTAQANISVDIADTDTAATIAWTFSGGRSNRTVTGTGTTASLTTSGTGTDDGPWTLTATASDGTNVSPPGTIAQFTVDQTPPTVPVLTATTPALVAISPNAFVNQIPLITASTNEAGTIFWTLDGSNPPTALPEPTQGAPVALTLPPGILDGLHTITASATDAAGNRSPLPDATFSFTLDRVPPLAPRLNPDIGSIVNTPPVTTMQSTEAAGTVQFRWTLDGGSPQVGPRIDLTGLADGSHVIDAWVIDQAGNVSPHTNRPFVLDRSAPAPPTITAIPAVMNHAPNPTITGPGGSTILWSLVGPRSTTGQGASPDNVALPSLPEGDYTLSARALGANGNYSASAAVSFRIDTTPPAAPRIVTGPDSVTGPNPTFTWSGEPGGSYSWTLSRGDLVVLGPKTTTGTRARARRLLAGKYLFSVRQIDAAGNVGPPSKLVFSVSARGRLVRGRALLVKPFGPLRPRFGAIIRSGQHLTLVWAYDSHRRARLFNVQIYNNKGRKVLSVFVRHQRFVVPLRIRREAGERFYWQVWPYWGRRLGYARRQIGISFFDVVGKHSPLLAEVHRPGHRRAP